MIRWLRKRDLRDGINTHLQELDKVLLRLEVAERDHLKSHEESPATGDCSVSASFASVRAAIHLRQRTLHAELRDLTGGWPWVKVTDDAWYHLIVSTDFEGMRFATYRHLSTGTSVGALLPGVN